MSGTEMTIGHSDTADIVVDDPYLSRRHALLSVDGGEVTVDDLNSTGGTFVNEERVDGPRRSAAWVITAR
jgi:pSer/pThr/pTyr-binding forkhead associated (FHA) protein